MKDLINHINKNLENRFKDIKVPHAIYKKSKKELHIKILYKKERDLITKTEFNELKKAVESFVNDNSVKIVLTTKKALIDEDVVKEFVYRFLRHNYSAMISTFSKKDVSATISDNNVAINLAIDEGNFNFLQSKKIDDEIKSFFEKYFFETFSVELRSIKKEDLNDFLDERISKINKSLITPEEEKPAIVEVENITEFLGDKVVEQPVAPESVLTATSGVAVAGNVRVIVKKSYTSKQKNEQGGFIQRDYFNFQIVSDSGSISCVLFLPQAEVERVEEELIEGEYIVAYGDTEMFNDKLSFRVRRISLCTPKFVEKKEIEYKKENENYIFVKPEKHVSLEQSNLFDVEEKVNDFLLNNDVVVFDLETTGLESSVNEIIEVGAVRIVKGKMTETFSALVKPKQLISEEITGITGITNEMVKDSLSIDQVLPDFYKFTRGAVLSAYNIAFDYNFLYAASKRMKYNFDNRQIDTMYLARTKLPGLRNYRLKTVATELGVVLDNAHRAVYDAVATAEVFIKLSDDLK